MQKAAGRCATERIKEDFFFTRLGSGAVVEKKKWAKKFHK